MLWGVECCGELCVLESGVLCYGEWCVLGSGVLCYGEWSVVGSGALCEGMCYGGRVVLLRWDVLRDDVL